MTRLAPVASGLLLLLFTSGCGDGKGSVRGTVTFDGQPVKSGSITFVSTAGELVREGAVIRDGAFQTRVPPGTYKVELSGHRVTGTRTQKGFDGKDEVIELTGELFPEYYNTRTDLTEVIKSGDNIIVLNLKTR